MKLRRLTLIVLGVYAVLMVYSVLSRSLGIGGFNFVPLVGFLFALLHAGQREGWKRGLTLFGLVFAVSLLFESVGVATGMVYGPYHYTAKLGLKFLGLVPYLIPMTWFMMSYPSFVIADRLVPGAMRDWQRVVAVAALGGLAMTAWDVVMDPIMVAGGHWVWDTEGAYFGIPLQNFWGWWLTVFTTFGLYLLVRGKPAALPQAGFDRLGLLSYAVTAAGSIASAAAGGRGDLALIGFFVMAPWVISGWIWTTALPRSDVQVL